jgi:hypothetical protein
MTQPRHSVEQIIGKLRRAEGFRVATVPEPSTCVLALFGVGVTYLWRKRLVPTDGLRSRLMSVEGFGRPRTRLGKMIDTPDSAFILACDSTTLFMPSHAISLMTSTD